MVQMSVRAEKAENLRSAVGKIREAAGSGASLVVLPVRMLCSVQRGWRRNASTLRTGKNILAVLPRPSRERAQGH